MLMPRFSRLAGAALLALALAACATPKVAPSGFLQSYDALGASEETGAVRVSTSSAEKLAAYTSVQIDMPKMIEARLSEKDAEAMRMALADALAMELAVDRMIATAAGPATLLVRYAIVQVDTSNVALNVVTTALIGAVDYGSLALEAEVVDSVSGQQVAAITWARGAKASLLDAYSSTGNARALAPEFAKRLAMLISPKDPG